eukprot:COSAG01_NODE_4740_length_4777_cov_23.046815_4_plen_477_part_00
MPDTAQGDSFLSVVLDGRMLDQSVRVSPPTAVCPCSWGAVHFTRMETAVPVDACAHGGADYAGSLVLVDRGGGCDFATKALRVQGAGAGAMVLRDNSTGVPVIIELGPIPDVVTIPVVSVNLEAGNMLQSYAQEDSGQHYSFELHTEDCPLSINLYVSQAALWALGVFACVAGAYLSADHERYIATTLLPYSYRILDDDGASSVDSDRDDSESSSISLLQAVAFTAFASALLVVLYFFIGELIIVIIVVYCLAAARSMHRLLCLLCASRLCPTLYRRVCALPLLGDTPPLAVLAFFPAAAVCCTWFFYRHASWAWALLDLMSLSLCIEIPTLISVDNMKVMTALLCMMFVYDNFWVFLSAYIFKTSVMIAVATGGGGGRIAADAVYASSRVRVLGAGHRGRRHTRAAARSQPPAGLREGGLAVLVRQLLRLRLCWLRGGLGHGRCGVADHWRRAARAVVSRAVYPRHRPCDGMAEG